MAEIANSAENSRIRAEIWGDFVGWDNRRRGENGFLVNQLKEHMSRRILDVASLTWRWDFYQTDFWPNFREE